MQTWECAGFGEQPSAAARRSLSRVLWAGSLAVAGSVLGAASAIAAEPGQADEPRGDLPGPLISTVESARAAGALVTEAGQEPGWLIDTVDRPSATAGFVPDVERAVGELTGAVATDFIVEVVSGHDSSEPSFTTHTKSDPPISVTDPGTARVAAQTLTTFAPAPKTSADGAPLTSFDEIGVVRPAGQDGESAVIHSSLDAGTDGPLDPPGRTLGVPRPSLLVTPGAGPGAPHVGALGAATSADQVGPSSHALLPEEAVLRARLFSAAAHARDVGAEPLREANDPPVSPD